MTIATTALTSTECFGPTTLATVRLDFLSPVGFGLTPPDALEILRQVVLATADWMAVGRAIGMTTAELRDFENAFEHDEKSKARKMLGSRSIRPCVIN
jgi:hypothetical protein